MTPLIDVCLVLLIFFILTTTYANLEKIMEAANISAERVEGVRVIRSKEVLEQTMVPVEVRQKGDESVVFVGFGDSKKQVDLADLAGVLKDYAGGAKRRKLLLQYDRKVPHGVIVKIQDDAKTAGMDEVLFQVP
jgi:biopolymer transport protein ExbD